MAQALVALPLVVRTLTPVLGGIDDRQRQAAASLGASPWRTLLTVDLPVVWKPMLAASGFAFAASLGEFGATSFLARDDSPTLPVVIFRLIGHPGEMNYGMALAASVVLADRHGRGDARRRAAPRAGCGSVLMSVDDAPGHRRHRPLRRRRAVDAVDDRVARPRHRPGARRARPVGLRQVHAAAGGRRARAAVVRLDLLRRHRPRRHADPQARLRADVPGRPALRPPHGRPQRRLRAAAAAYAVGAGRRAGAGAARARRPRRATTTGCPARCPAASGSGSRWPGRWPSSRG